MRESRTYACCSCCNPVNYAHRVKPDCHPSPCDIHVEGLAPVDIAWGKFYREDRSIPTVVKSVVNFMAGWDAALKDITEPKEGGSK